MTTSAQRIRLTGTAYAAGGILWFVLAVVQAAIWGIEPPAGSAAFYVIEAVFAIAQMLLLFGFFGVLWSEGVGRGVFGKIAFGIAVLGHLVFVAGEIHSLTSGRLSDLLAVGAMVSAIGIVLTGIATLMAQRWQGWTRWMPLLTGLYPLLVMFPFIFIADEPNPFAIAGWGLLRLALGLAIRVQAETVSATAPTHVSVSQRGV